MSLIPKTIIVRQKMQFEERIDKILKEYPAEQRYSLAILQDIQHEFQYIPKDAMEAVAEYLNLPLSSLYSMATFYKALSLKPKGRNIIKLCDALLKRRRVNPMTNM